MCLGRNSLIVLLDDDFLWRLQQDKLERITVGELMNLCVVPLCQNVFVNVSLRGALLRVVAELGDDGAAVAFHLAIGLCVVGTPWRRRCQFPGFCSYTEQP